MLYYDKPITTMAACYALLNSLPWKSLYTAAPWNGDEHRRVWTCFCVHARKNVKVCVSVYVLAACAHTLVSLVVL